MGRYDVPYISAFIADYLPVQTDYQASKAGVEGIENRLASEWAAYGIPVHDINPGYVDTEVSSDGDEQGRVRS